MMNQQLEQGACAGCGVKLQTESNDKLGFIPAFGLGSGTGDLPALFPNQEL